MIIICLLIFLIKYFVTITIAAVVVAYLIMLLDFQQTCKLTYATVSCDLFDLLFPRHKVESCFACCVFTTTNHSL